MIDHLPGEERWGEKLMELKNDVKEYKRQTHSRRRELYGERQCLRVPAPRARAKPRQLECGDEP